MQCGCAPGEEGGIQVLAGLTLCSQTKVPGLAKPAEKII
jgi:hypothetical protein